MTYFLLVSVMVTILAIIYVWYVTRRMNVIADDEPLQLHTDEDRLATSWYTLNTRKSVDLEIDDISTASTFLKRVCDIEANRNLIVIGKDLQTVYKSITGQNLATKYSEGIDTIFDIRALIGRSGEIALIHDPNILTRMSRAVQKNRLTIDLSEVKAIMNSELDPIAREYFGKLLKSRWEKILAIPDTRRINCEGSYLYIEIENTTTDDNITIFGNVMAANTPFGARINLLCKDVEFETFLKRWRTSLLGVMEVIN